MRVKDLFYTIVISAITSLIITGILISAGILQTRRPPITESYRIEQTFSKSLTGSFDNNLKEYILSEKIHLQNGTDKASLRILHFHLEFNEIDMLKMYVRLVDQVSQKVILEREIKSYPEIVIVDTSLKVEKPYYVYIWIGSVENFTFSYNATIIQEIYS